MNIEDRLKEKEILITGGLGFIGSNLAIRLVEKFDAKVTILDALIEEYGGNEFNIEPIKDKVKVGIGDICDKSLVDHLVKNKDYIFHLAGQVSHVLSQTDPFKDVDYNLLGTLVLLEACRKNNPKCRLIYTGTRGQYGSVKELPASENMPSNPIDIHEITNNAAEQTFNVYSRKYTIRSVLTRLTNIYGPRSQMKSNKFGVFNWFIRLAMDDAEIPLFGDDFSGYGNILRDFVYIDDCVDALILLSVSNKCYGKMFNIGNDEPVTFEEAVEKIVKIAESGKIVYREFSSERKAQEPGDFYSDITKIQQFIGWRPNTKLDDGIRKTIDYYKQYKSYYW